MQWVGPVSSVARLETQALQGDNGTRGSWVLVPLGRPAGASSLDMEVVCRWRSRGPGCFRADAGESSVPSLARAGPLGRRGRRLPVVGRGRHRRGAVIRGGPVPGRVPGCLDCQHPCVQNGAQCQQGFRLGEPPLAGIAWDPKAPKAHPCRQRGLSSAHQFCRVQVKLSVLIVLGRLGTK